MRTDRRPGRPRPRAAALLVALALAATGCGGAAAVGDDAGGATAGDGAGSAAARRAAAQLQVEVIPREGDPGELWGQQLDPPLVTPDIELTAADGSAYDWATDADAELTMVYFGYTSCPDVCPTHMAAIARALDDVAPEVRDAVDVLFVSVDPTTDTPERLTSYLDSFDADITGLTGTPDEIDAALSSVGLPPTAADADAEGEPEHPSAVLGYRADGEGVVAWPFGTTPAIYAHDIGLLTDGASS